jgi:hypothetical protein
MEPVGRAHLDPDDLVLGVTVGALADHGVRLDHRGNMASAKPPSLNMLNWARCWGLSQQRAHNAGCETPASILIVEKYDIDLHPVCPCAPNICFCAPPLSRPVSASAKSCPFACHCRVLYG